MRLAGDEAQKPVGRIQFEDREPSSGIDFVLDNATTPDKTLIEGVLGGVALLDFDHDGLLAILFPQAPISAELIRR